MCTLRVEKAPVGSLVVDSLPWSKGGTPDQAKALRNRGVSCLVGYLGAMTPARVQTLLYAGLAFMPVTFAGEYKDGAADEIRQLQALGIPPGATVWLDLEGAEAFRTDPVKLADMINAWARDIKAGGWMPGLYVGVPQPLTSAELYSLSVVRYWHGQGSVRDRFGQLAEPFKSFRHCRGWNMIQAAPSVTWGGVLVDANLVLGDYKGDVPSWVVGD